MAYTAFIFNTTEFIPIGLLTGIATDFGMSEAQASSIISVYAWFVALMSLPLMLLVGRYDFRKILLGIVGLFVLSHAVSAVAPNFAVLMASRLGVACSHAIFWSVISPLAVQIAPKGRSETALSMIITGTSLAMIAGMPLGRVVGLHLGWRYSFGCIGAAALLAFLLLLFMFPKTPNNQSVSLNSLPVLFRNPVVRALYVFTFLSVMAHYTCYSYIEPFFKQVARLADGQVTLLLTIFGLAGVGASVLFSRFYHGYGKVFLPFITASLAAVLLLLRHDASGFYPSVAHCILWGLTFTLFNLVLEFEVIRNTGRYSTIAVSIYSSIFNVGIGCGAVAGGAALTTFSIANIGYAGGVVAVVASVYAGIRLLSRLYKLAQKA